MNFKKRGEVIFPPGQLLYFLETDIDLNELYLPLSPIYFSQYLVTSNLPDESNEIAVEL